MPAHAPYFEGPQKPLAKEHSMVIELVILARFVYRKRAEIQTGIESTCVHCLQDADEKEHADHDKA